ncbi:MAG: Tim44 domain-containing protein [Thermodesulfovibrionales bacterium]
MKMKKILLFFTIALFFAAAVEESAFARAGRSGSSGGSTLGSRGSRTYSAPSGSPSSSRNPYQDQYQSQQGSTTPYSAQTPAPSGGFFRSLAGGLAGGFLGALLFRSLGFGSYGGGFGGGFGVLEILLIGLIIFVVYKMVQSRRRPAYGGAYPDRRPEPPFRYQPSEEAPYRRMPVQDAPAAAPYGNDLEAGLSHLRQFDPGFDESRFREQATDIFFAVQAAWMNRDLEPARSLLAPEIHGELRDQLARLKAEGRINRLENIAMRGVEITEVWQEQGKDFITAAITANVLDYVTDEAGRVVEGSRTEPVKFREFWTFVRAVGASPWQLSAIQQGE